MPSETHQHLFGRLRQIAGRVQNAIETNDYNALHPLIDEQNTVIYQLEAAGTCSDLSLLAYLTETRNRIAGVVPVIQKHRDELADQLKTRSTRKKLNQAYGR